MIKIKEGVDISNSTPRIHTPLEFRDLLLAIARSANKASNDGLKVIKARVQLLITDEIQELNNERA